MRAGAANGWENPELYEALKNWVESHYPSLVNRVNRAGARRCRSTDLLGIFPPYEPEARALNQILDDLAESRGETEAHQSSRSLVTLLLCRLPQLSIGHVRAAAFNDLYAGLEQCLYRWGEIEFVAEVDFWNVGLPEVPEIEFDAFKLCRLTEEEREARPPSLRAMGFSPLVADRAAPRATLVHGDRIGRHIDLERSWVVEYGTTVLGDVLKRPAEQLLLALRLASPGTVWLGDRRVTIHNALLDTFNTVDESPAGSAWTRHHAKGWRSWFSGDEQPVLARYELTGEKAAYTQYLWSQLDEDALEQRGLRLPVMRFGRSFHHDIPEDRFIDLWVGLESLVGCRERSITKRMAARIAVLTCPEPTAWRDVQQQAANSYKARCDILHGREATQEQFEEFWDPTEGYLRLILNQVLEAGGRFSDEQLNEIYERFVRVAAQADPTL